MLKLYGSKHTVFHLAYETCDINHAAWPWLHVRQTKCDVMQDLTPYVMHSKASRMKWDLYKMPGLGSGL